MKVYAYYPETERGYVYRIDDNDTIYERVLHPNGGWDKETEIGAGIDRFDDIVRELIDTGALVGTEKTYVLEHCKWELTDDARVSHIDLSICNLDEYLEPYDVVYELRTSGAEAIGIDVPEEVFDPDDDSDTIVDIIRTSIVEAYKRKDLRWILTMHDKQALAGKNVDRIIRRGLQDGQLLRLSVSTEEAVAYFGLVDVAVSVHLFFTHNR